MDEKRIESIENLLIDLIRIVGNTNAIVEELRDKVDGLDKRMDRLEARMDSLEVKVDVMQRDMDIMKFAVITREDIRHIDGRLDFQVEKLSRQEEADIYRLKRCVGIK